MSDTPEKNVYAIVSRYPKVVDYLSEFPGKLADVEAIVDEIHGVFNEKIVQFSTRFIDKTLLKLYDQVHLGLNDSFDIEELEQKYHLILVPNHQSHADYIALTYLFYKKFKRPIHIAGGINLNVFLLGKFFRNTGAFFIRRSFQNDRLYKVVFEGYIYYLLELNKIVEFFFEGGRSRTGKLLPPRFGLFQALLEAHSNMDKAKPLMFLPISVAHEYVPEEKAHEREIKGGKKVKEKSTDIFSVFKLYNKKLGSLHVRVGEGIVVDEFDHVREKTQEVAFKCFRAVGEGMPITPTSLLALVMLDEPSGAMSWKMIESKANEIISFCRRFSIPLTPSLHDENLTFISLRKALDILMANNKVRVIDREILNETFFTVKKEFRVQLLYSKNMILHHFLVPFIINSAWLNLFNGSIKNVQELTKFLMTKRRELRFEFYLPTIKEMVDKALDIVSYAVGRKVANLDECLHLTTSEMYQIAHKIRRFSTALSYIYEVYFLVAKSLEHLGTKPFKQEKLFEVYKEIHEMEVSHGRVVKYLESFSVPFIKNSIPYFIHSDIIKEVGEKEYQVTAPDKIEYYIEKFAFDVNDQVTVNLKFN